MQPEISQSTQQSAEHSPVPQGIGPEQVPTLPPLEAGPLGGQERFEQAAEAGARVNDAAAASTTATAIATPVAPVQAPVSQSAASTTTPMVAADEDLIEKEWVDKAKEIITQTKDDPHARTAQVNALQRDYLQKRYGKVVGTSD